MSIIFLIANAQRWAIYGYSLSLKHIPRGNTCRDDTCNWFWKQLLQLHVCTARTAWSNYSYARLAQPGPNRTKLCWPCIAAIAGDSDSEIKLVSVLFGKCTTLVATKCWLMETRLPRGDQWKAEKLGVFRRWPISRCFIKSDRAVLFIEHSISFRLNGEHWRTVQCNGVRFPQHENSLKSLVSYLK